MWSIVEKCFLKPDWMHCSFSSSILVIDYFREYFVQHWQKAYQPVVLQIFVVIFLEQEHYYSILLFLWDFLTWQISVVQLCQANIQNLSSFFIISIVISSLPGAFPAFIFFIANSTSSSKICVLPSLQIAFFYMNFAVVKFLVVLPYSFHQFAPVVN